MDTAEAVGHLARDVEFPTRISARGVIAGLLVGLAFEVMLMVLGAAIGLTAFEPRGDVAKGLGIGFAGWLLLSLIVSAFVGGWVASGAAHAVRKRDGVLHGLVTWAAVTLVGVSLLGGAVRSAVGGVFGVAKAAQQQMGAQQQGDVQQKLGAIVDQANANPDQIAARADRAAGGAAIGTWSIFAALLLPLLAAVGGGVVGSSRERRVTGLPRERELRHREPIVRAPSRPGEIPTRPLPST